MDLNRSLIVRGIFKARELVLGTEPDAAERPQGIVALTTSIGWGVLAEVPGREFSPSSRCADCAHPPAWRRADTRGGASARPPTPVNERLFETPHRGIDLAGRQRPVGDEGIQNLRGNRL
jgi:hypothetical protein